MAMSLPEEDAEWMLDELRSRRGDEKTAADKAARDIRTQIQQTERRQQRLQEAYLNEVVSLEEFRSSKTSL